MTTQVLSKNQYLDPKVVSGMYEQGFLFGRIEPGFMYLQRSLRIDLHKFLPNSENRRVLRKSEVSIAERVLPISPELYDWRIHKLAKDFYSQKFSDVEFSANKAKSLLSDDYHFTSLFEFRRAVNVADFADGFAICYLNEEILHYCYPFYNLGLVNTNLGMSMLLQSILFAQLHGKRYAYLGGATRPADKYKLQFMGLEWWDNGTWSRDLDKLKSLLDSSSSHS